MSLFCDSCNAINLTAQSKLTPNITQDVKQNTAVYYLIPPWLCYVFLSLLSIHSCQVGEKDNPAPEKASAANRLLPIVDAILISQFTLHSVRFAH